MYSKSKAMQTGATSWLQLGIANEIRHHGTKLRKNREVRSPRIENR